MSEEKKTIKNPLSLQIDPALFEKAGDEEKAQQVTMRESVSFMKDAMRRLRKNHIAMISLFIIVFIALIAFIVPNFYPYTYTKQDVTAQNLAPFQYSAKEQAKIDKGGSVFPHIMGTDALGRDYAIRVIYGTRISLLVGIFSALIVIVIGIVYGSISGYFGGKVDLIMMRIVDIIYSLPDVLIVILLSVAIKDWVAASKSDLVSRLGAGMVSIFIVFGLLYWVSMARQVRGQILSIKEQEYVLASKAIGAHDPELRVRHHHHRRHADPERHLHRELPELPGPRRLRADAVPRLARLGRAHRSALLPVPAPVPGAGDLPDRPGLQPARERPARRLRPEAAFIRRTEYEHA